MLLTDQQMLLPVFDREPAFRLDVERAVCLWEPKSGCKWMPLRPDVGDLVLLVADFETGLLNLAETVSSSPDL